MLLHWINLGRDEDDGAQNPSQHRIRFTTEQLSAIRIAAEQEQSFISVMSSRFAMELTTTRLLLAHMDLLDARIHRLGAVARIVLNEDVFECMQMCFSFRHRALQYQRTRPIQYSAKSRSRSGHWLASRAFSLLAGKWRAVSVDARLFPSLRKVRKTYFQFRKL